MKKHWLAFGALTAMLLSGTAMAQQTDTLRFRIGEDPETLYNVNTISLSANSALGDYMIERLVHIDRSGKASPLLAESWTVSTDQTQITFKLRSGIKFHDDTVFDAAAVKAQFDNILDPKNASPVKPFIGPLKSVEVIDPSTVRFTFEKPFAPFFNVLAGPSFGINSPTAVTRLGRTYGRSPVGTGPYKFKNWVAGTEINMERNPNFRQFRSDAVNKGPALTEKVQLRVIQEEGVAQAALETGELTAAGLQADVITRFANDPKFNVVVAKNATNLVFLEFNMKRAPFNDPKFRRALSHAIDRKAAVEAAWSGYANEALGPLALGIPGFDKAVVDRHAAPFDPAKAKALFAEAGWTRVGGKLTKDGKPANFLIKSYAGFTHIERTLAVVQSNLKDIGIETKLETADWGAFYPSLLRDEYDMDLMRWTFNDPVVLSNLFRDTGHRKVLMPNPDIDAILNRCDGLMDPEARLTCISEAQKILLEQMTIVPVLTNWIVIATQKNVEQYNLDFNGALIAADVRIVRR